MRKIMKPRIRSPKNGFYIEAVSTDQHFYIMTIEENMVMLYGIEPLQGNLWHEQKIMGVAIRNNNIETAVHTLAKMNKVYLPASTISCFSKAASALTEVKTLFPASRKQPQLSPR
jgi:5-bromo-4-chloroindolyl phosphate hydrolysis protein